MDSIQPHRIALKSRVVLEKPKAHMSSQYFCRKSRLDTSRIIHEVCIRDGSWEMQSMRAVINCGMTSIFMTLTLRKRLGLADEPAYVTTPGLNGQVMAHTSGSQKMAFMVQYMEHLLPVQESEVLLVPMLAYELVLGLPWFQSRTPDINRQRGRLLALPTAEEAEVVEVHQLDHQECAGYVPGSMAREEK